MTYALRQQFQDMDRTVQADERVKLADLKATQERNASAARAAELRNIPAFSDVNFERPTQAPEQAQTQTAPTGGGTAYVGRPQGKLADKTIEVSEASKRLSAAKNQRPVSPAIQFSRMVEQDGKLRHQPAADNRGLMLPRAVPDAAVNSLESRLQGLQSEEAARQRGKAPVQSSPGVPTGASFVDRIRHVESRGNVNAVGPYVPGQGTAKGDMQVMDRTNMDPGFGVRPAQNNSPEERSRVGREYAQAMLNRYGNEAEAAAAYNWGPGNYDRWKAAGANPAQMPAETRNYVAQVAGGGAAPQQGRPQQTAQGAPQQQAPQYQPNPQMKALVERHIGELAARYQQIQRLAQNTLDPTEVDKLRLAAMDVQSKVRDMRILGAVSMGYMSHADAAQMSPTIATMLQKQAEAQSKAAGEIAVENVKGVNTLQNTQLRGLMDQEAAATAPVRLQPVTNQFNGNQGAFNPVTGAYTPFAQAPNTVTLR